MLLKRLELRGFKSFADPTEFEFDRGVTAIVGPNGSGKSNIADAVRWVLGEQSLRSLRSKKTEDIIFAGSAVRTSLGMAEVSLTFDNSDQRFDLPYAEVVLTRRAYRSGENEYLVNRERIRWRDLMELLQKANITSNGYTVIGQGLVDAALSLKADERRELLEEAADVKRYRARLVEAREKLQATQQNILRANDVANEIKPRLAQLEEQARRLRQHQEISGELRSLQRQWFAHQWNTLSCRLAEAQECEEKAKSRWQSLQEDERRQAQLIDSLAVERQELEAETSDHQAEIAKVRSRHQEVQRALAVQQERYSATLRHLEELQGELATLDRERNAENQHVAALRRRVSELESQERAVAEQLRELEQRLADCRQRRGSLSAALEAAQQRAYEIATRGAEWRNRLASLRDRWQEVHKEREKNRRLVEEGRKKLVDCVSAVEEAQRRMRALEAELSELAGQSESLWTQIEEQRAKQQEILVKQSETRAQLGQLRTRLELLTRLQTSRAGYYPGVKAVLEAAGRDGHRDGLSGIVGIVAELIRAPVELETAVEMALGSHAQDVVVARWTDAEAAIEFLKRTAAGRATFLPLDTLRLAGKKASFEPAADDLAQTSRLAARWPPQGESGVVGVGAQLVQYESHLAPIAWYLLGRTLIVDSLPTARRILKRCPGGWLMVTLAGEIVRPGGAVTGGSSGKQGTIGLLVRERELRELPQAIESCEASNAALVEALALKRQEEAALISRHREVQQRVEEVQRQLDEASRALNGAQRTADRLEREMVWWQAGQERLDSELEALRGRETHITGELAVIEEEQRQHGEYLASARQQSADAETAERAAAAAVNEAARLVAVRQGEIRSSRELLETRLSRLAAVDKQLSAKRSRLSDLRELEEAGRVEQKDLEAELARHAATLQALDQALCEAKASLESLYKREEEARQEKSRLARELHQAEVAWREAAVETSRWREEADRLRQQLENEGLGGDVAPDWNPRQLILPLKGEGDGEVPAVVPADAENLKRRIDELKGRLRALGPVNPQAIAEYDDTRARHTFLTEQVLDLERASASLQRVIGELERTSRKRFEDTFAAVAREFRKHFVNLFGGGSAGLVLNRDGEEPGVEIVAQPPGKRPQSLSLLSGGERALTAAALIFAVLEVVPTPFAVLDEVDAALDDVNVVRFCHTLSSLSERTQFIVITHNRGTMDIAETLYGVSMSESNTSRVISLRLPAVVEGNA